MIFLPSQFHYYDVHIVLHFLVHHVVEYGSHGALVSYTYIFQLKGHHYLVEILNRRSERSLFYIFWCHPNLIFFAEFVHKGEHGIFYGRIYQ